MTASHGTDRRQRVACDWPLGESDFREPVAVAGLVIALAADDWSGFGREARRQHLELRA